MKLLLLKVITIACCKMTAFWAGIKTPKEVFACDNEYGNKERAEGTNEKSVTSWSIYDKIDKNIKICRILYFICIPQFLREG